MSDLRYSLITKTTNKKTGPISVLTSSFYTCPDSCPFKRNGCYADGGPLRIHWDKLTRGERGDCFTDLIHKLRMLGKGQLIRLFQAGDLPGLNDRIRLKEIRRLVKALENWKAYGYTHKPLDYHDNNKAIEYCNNNNVCINLSANNLKHADILYDYKIGPVVTTLSAKTVKNTRTPKGRQVVICPAVLNENATCSTCGGKKGPLCSRVDRKIIIGFPAHGSSFKKVSEFSKI